MGIFRHSEFTFKTVSKLHGLLYRINQDLNKKIPVDIQLRKYLTQSIGWVNGSMEDLGEAIKLTYEINSVPFKILLRKDSSDANVFIQCILNREYDIISSLAHTFRGENPLRIIDAGANIGVAAIHFNCAFNRECEIMCIEPLDANAELLEKNLQANSYSNISVVRKVLWNKMAYLKPITEHRKGAEWGFALEETNDPKESAIEVTTIRDIMSDKNWTGIDLLKIDIEGAEAVIFNDEECLKSFLPHTKLITIEVHSKFISKESIREKLQAHGYAVFETGEHLVGVNTVQKEC
jgi:FkbM family methyltransferase